MWSSIAADDDQTPLDIEHLLRLAQVSRQAWDVSGFVSFIALPLADQIALVYADLLSRHPDQAGYDTYCAELLSGRQTILDVRDAIASSGEFIRRPRSADERVGQWLVWGALKVVERHLVAAPSLDHADVFRKLTGPQLEALRVLERPFRSGQETRFYLARLALGPKPRPEDVESWTSDHRTQIEAAVEVLLARSARHFAEAHRAPVLLKGLLSSLEPGVAGRRIGRSIATVPGRAGLVASGPAPQIRQGQFILRAKLTPVTGVPPQAGEHLALQVNYGNYIIAERRVELFPAAPDLVELHYTISSKLAPLLSKLMLTVSVSADGSFGFVITEIEIVDCGEPDSIASMMAAEIDWSSQIRIGAAGEASPGAIVASRPKTAGHLFFGPYADLLPGCYELSVVSTVTFKRDGRDQVMLEAVAGAAVLAAAYILVGSGQNHFTLPFNVEQFMPLVDAKEPIEFRLWVPGTFDIVINRIACRLVK